MQHSTHIPEVPQLTEFTNFVWHSALQKEGHPILTLSKIEGEIPDIPEHFLPPTYALEFVVKGTIKGKINYTDVLIPSNSCVLYMADSLLEKPEISKDCVFYVLGFTTQFAEALNTQITQNQLSKVLMRPIWQITGQQMEIVVQYLDLIRTMIEENKYYPTLNLVRSLLYFLADDYQVDPQQSQSISRGEKICGQYLSLVEVNCRKQHRVEWYASQMCLAPKYLSNVVKQTLGTSPNACIDDALLRQAKSILSSTSLSIQQISDLLGFQNQSHFGTFFKRRTGLSPKAFKNTIQ